ncbi:MAG TPA: Z-ring formation inhibitor MciZ [Bacillota bacterium]|nr:Z-ring formation inhibitor MciZ [Bacillota bacterium]
MKIYYSENSLRLCGKVWEVRNKLKSWSKLPISVKDLLVSKGH